VEDTDKQLKDKPAPADLSDPETPKVDMGLGSREQQQGGASPESKNRSEGS